MISCNREEIRHPSIAPTNLSNLIKDRRDPKLPSRPVNLKFTASTISAIYVRVTFDTSGPTVSNLNLDADGDRDPALAAGGL